MSTFTAYAICDTDGGRHEPRVLFAHIYPTERRAEERRERLFDDVKEYYPICLVRIEIESTGRAEGDFSLIAPRSCA